MKVDAYIKTNVGDKVKVGDFVYQVARKWSYGNTFLFDLEYKDKSGVVVSGGTIDCCVAKKIRVNNP